jgi:DnaK suppressor protein
MEPRERKPRRPTPGSATAPLAAPSGAAPSSATPNNPTPSSAAPRRRAQLAHPDSGLSVEQVEMLHRMLLDVRRTLLQEHVEHLDSGRFNTERIPESEEAAAFDTSQSTLIDLAEHERRRLVEIERALRKLDDGSYGVSEESGEPIGFERLRVLPWARLSAADQEDLERRSRDRGR